MKVIIAYDISTLDSRSKSRYRKVVGICKSFGIRQQKSVFECNLNRALLKDLLKKIKLIQNGTEDRVTVYRVLKIMSVGSAQEGLLSKDTAWIY